MSEIYYVLTIVTNVQAPHRFDEYQYISNTRLIFAAIEPADQSISATLHYINIILGYQSNWTKINTEPYQNHKKRDFIQLSWLQSRRNSSSYQN